MAVMEHRPFAALLGATVPFEPSQVTVTSHAGRDTTGWRCDAGRRVGFGERRGKTSYRSEVIALARAIVSAARSHGEGRDRHPRAVYPCTGGEERHWHMSAWPGGGGGRVLIHGGPPPSLAHPRPSLSPND